MTIRYGNIAIALHWLIALLVFAGWSMGYYMEDLRISPQKLKLYSWHKWIGISVLILTCVRAAWRATHAPPPANPAHALWQRRLASATHISFYGLLFALPMSGWLFSSASGYPVKYFGLILLPDLVEKSQSLASLLGDVHQVLAMLLAGLLVLHIAGALKHQLIEKDGTLKRMLPFGGQQD